MATFNESGTPPPVRRGPVFNLPSTPAGWDDKRSDLIRIVDPTGGAVAWFAPRHATQCIGFSVRTPREKGQSWTSVFAPVLDAADAVPYGCAVIASVYRPARQPRPPGQWLEQPGSGWLLGLRDPTSVVLGTSIVTTVWEGDVEGTATVVDLRLEARLEDSSLAITLQATNRGSTPCMVKLGLQPVFQREFFSNPHAWSVLAADGRPLPEPTAHSGLLTGNETPLASFDENELPVICQVRRERAAEVGVTLEKGVKHLSASLSPRDESLVLSVLHATAGAPALLLPGSRAQLEVSFGLSRIA
jgi:hypothetical protein